MNQTRKATVLAAAMLAVMVGLVAITTAASPKPGAVYKGNSTDRGKVTLTINRSGSKLKAEVVDSCREQTTIRGIKVKDTGRFKGEVLGSADIVVFTIKGKFKTRRKAEGTISSVACSGAEREFTVIKQD